MSDRAKAQSVHEAASKRARFRSLLVPVDLTPASDRVLGRATLLPLTDDARLTLLHVVPRSLPAVAQRRAERDARKALADEVRHLAKSLPRTVSIEPVVKIGGVATEIATRATSLKAELVVMGRGGGRTLRDVFLGSTAERVIRRAHIPVLVIRLPPRAAYTRPALALDRDQAAHRIIQLMLRIISLPRARVTLIHAFDVPYRGLAYPSLSEDDAHERDRAFQLAATQVLAQLVATSLTKAKVPPEIAPVWKTHIRYGSPRMVIQKAVKKSETDLLVLGTHGYSGAAHMFLGTVAGDVLREVACDVLVVPPRPGK